MRNSESDKQRLRLKQLSLCCCSLCCLVAATILAIYQKKRQAQNRIEQTLVSGLSSTNNANINFRSCSRSYYTLICCILLCYLQLLSIVFYSAPLIPDTAALIDTHGSCLSNCNLYLYHSIYWYISIHFHLFSSSIKKLS